ncbi:hypothetical protein [Pseudooceanicola sp.]|uniref:hypothetical protein n=1 Tax=Pseudooceanicola sp. TaxID=1914328 RepID=UPI004058817A
MKSAEKLAYFFDASDLGSVFADWPEEIGLVLCMDEEGGCEMLLHHRDEGREIIRRVAGVLGRPVGEFAVVPQVEGLPTRRVLFSDEQKLLKLVAAEKDLPEMAADHLINFRFDRERRARKKAEQALVEAEVQRWRPRLHLFDVRPKLKKRAEPAIAGGYVRANEVRDKECRFADGVLSHGKRGVRLVIAPEKVTARTHAVKVTELAFRDDFSRFVIPREAVGPWPGEEALVLDMADDLFPDALLHRLTDRPRRAEVTVTAHGVFVAPMQVVEADALVEDAAAAPVPVKRPRRWRLTPLRVALVALTGMGLMTGSVMRAVDVSEVSPPLILWADR